MRLSTLPAYCNANLTQARRLTGTLRTMDQALVACWNGITQRFEVWGPSKSEGWAMLTRLERPDGTPIDPDVYPYVVLEGLYQRQKKNTADLSEEAQALKLKRAWERSMDEAGERAKYVAAAVAQERTGALRYGADDVFAGLKAAEGSA